MAPNTTTTLSCPHPPKSTQPTKPVSQTRLAPRIVHRDLKGGNALVTRNGVVKLTDFGASKIVSNAAQTDVMKSMRGSVLWMAPEVLKGKGYGE